MSATYVQRFPPEHNAANEELRAQLAGLVIESVDFGYQCERERDTDGDDIMRLNTNRGPVVISSLLVFGPKIAQSVDTGELK